MNPLEKLESCKSQFNDLLGDITLPKIAIVLGSGLGAHADAVVADAVIPYADIKDFPTSTAPGHEGHFVIGTLAGVPIIVMRGRVHYYEGYAMEDVVLPMRMLASLGVETFILTNAAGGIQDGMRPGDLMLITDHIASFVPSPLIGPNNDEWGVRFPDMTQVYDLEMQDIIRNAARKIDLDLKEGIYLQVTGPPFETPAEVRAYRILGADVAGMSTAVEAVALRHMGVRVAGISCVTNLASGLGAGLLTAEEVIEVGIQTADTFIALLTTMLTKMES